MRHKGLAAGVSTIALPALALGAGGPAKTTLTVRRDPTSPTIQSLALAAREDPPDPIKPSANDLVRARVLSADSKLRARFESDYPDTFGGSYTDYVNGDITKPVSVYQTVGPAGNLPNIIRDVYSSVTTDEALWPELRFEQVPHSLRELHTAQARIHNDTATLAQSGIAVTSTGINDEKNSVVVAVAPRATFVRKDGTEAAASSVDVKQATTMLDERYRDGPPLDVREMGEGANQDRFSDVAPWNGGDLILANNPVGQACTTGFGMVGNNTGNSYIITAGHCTAGGQPPFNTYAWKNDAPPLTVTGADTVGVVTQSTGADQIGDYAYIQTPSSNLIWKSISTREYVLADRTPKLNDVVCREGAATIFLGGNQQCSQIDVIDAWPSTINLWPGVTANRFFAPNAPGNAGDSGGPWVYPLSTGVLAEGIIVAGYGQADCGACDPQQHGEGESMPWIESYSQATVRTY